MFSITGLAVIGGTLLAVVAFFGVVHIIKHIRWVP